MKGTIFCLLFLMCTPGVFAQNWSKEIVRRNKKLPGQVAPYDMVLVPAKDNIPAYYISVIEEPNINYVIYLQWLLYSYVDYPAVVIQALPKMPGDTSLSKINEPYITGYLTNPAYAYYPVVNLSWDQIQNYLAWKTDRLNEAIFCRIEPAFFNPMHYVNENIFNTEAYYTNQFAFGHEFEDTGGDMLKSFNTGVAFTGFRLPTEMEWDNARKMQLEPPFGSKKYPKQYPLHPFGEGYFTLMWGDYYSKFPVHKLYGGGYYMAEYWSHLPGEQFYDVKTIVNYKTQKGSFEKVNYNPDQVALGLDSVFRCIYDYPLNSYGLINLDGGVKEWLLDTFAQQPVYTHWLNVMKMGGFNTEQAVLYDANGYISEKDSLGHHPFRFIGLDHKGDPRPIGRYMTNGSGYRVVKGGTWDKPGYYRAAMRGDSSATNVGFRCVLPYTGAPVIKGGLVNWDKPFKYTKACIPVLNENHWVLRDSFERTKREQKLRKKSDKEKLKQYRKAHRKLKQTQ
ncbi:MAG: SUMF1/EgtB/PvdO family nonheme iron enzyme [Bacteroidia bacterium]|nr:SUMF1/EgtB/PvdO family nonheme iron enzyme [Bacteroidia bacterium]